MEPDRKQTMNSFSSLPVSPSTPQNSLSCFPEKQVICNNHKQAEKQLNCPIEQELRG